MLHNPNSIFDKKTLGYQKFDSWYFKSALNHFKTDLSDATSYKNRY